MNGLNIPDRAWFAALALGALGVTAVGMSLQHLFHLSPCPYCIFQRVLYLLIGVLALAGAFWPRACLAWSGLIGLLALGGGGLAAYQSWMQAYPELAPECGFSDPNLIERLVDWLGMQWPGWFLATGFCSSREWEFASLSMANWSCLLFLAIAFYVALLAKYRS